MSTIGSRLIEFIESINSNPHAFEARTGLANGMVGKLVKSGGSLGSEKLSDIFRAYPTLNPEWLLTGEGQKFKTTERIDDTTGTTIFARNLKRLRRDKGVNQEAVAVAIGKEPNTISNYERGVTEPSFSDAEKIARYFGVTMGDLIGSETISYRREPEDVDSCKDKDKTIKVLEELAAERLARIKDLERQLASLGKRDD